MKIQKAYDYNSENVCYRQANIAKAHTSRLYLATHTNVYVHEICHEAKGTYTNR